MRLSQIVNESGGEHQRRSMMGIPIVSVDTDPAEDFAAQARGGDDAKYTILGSGVYGTAYAERGQPGIVHKVSRLHSSPMQDGYTRFIQIVLHHRDNPFLPKIYDAVLYYVRARNSYTLHVTMERLRPIGTYKLADVMEYLWDQLGVDTSEVDVTGNPRFGRDSDGPWGSNFQNHNPDFHDKENERINAKTSLYWWIKQGENYDFMMKYADNEHAKTALQVALNAARGDVHTLDLHTGNWMVRLTSVGPQLVITDPVA